MTKHGPPAMDVNGLVLWEGRALSRPHVSAPTTPPKLYRKRRQVLPALLRAMSNVEWSEVEGNQVPSVNGPADSRIGKHSQVAVFRFQVSG